LDADCGFLSANLYGISIFGEEALANLSVESGPEGISGAIRIRSKTQGVCLALGEKVSLRVAF
jgi:coatomer subunit beta